MAHKAYGTWRFSYARHGPNKGHVKRECSSWLAYSFMAEIMFTIFVGITLLAALTSERVKCNMSRCMGAVDCECIDIKCRSHVVNFTEEICFTNTCLVWTLVVITQIEAPSITLLVAAAPRPHFEAREDH